MNRTKQPIVDRYALLQRKVEDLEHVHQEGKKAHLADIDRLKSELAKHQKQQMEHTELIEKQKKQNMLLEARVQDLKRSKSSEDTDLKELRSKLRALENERNRLQLGSSEVQDLKNSLQALETKRRDEVRERDSRIFELERNLAAEKRARETLSAQYQQLKKSSDSETKSATKKLQTLVDQKTAEASKLQQDLTRLQKDTGSREEDLVSQLEQHRVLLSQVASEFGRLATQSVRKRSHEDLQTEHQITQVQKLKLERKLANSEAQATELVHLIRRVQGNNLLLLQELSDTSQQLALIRQQFNETPNDLSSELQALLSIQQSLHHDELQLSKANGRTAELLSDFYRIQAVELTIASSLLAKELAVTDIITDQHSTHLSATLASHEAIASRLESLGKDYAKAQEQIGRALADKQCAERDLRNLTMKYEEKEAALGDVESHHNQALKREHTIIQQLRMNIQQGQAAEEALRQDVDSLSKEVQEIECYVEAYDVLSKQIASLISRNKIAEDEATQLSNYNAEILGHHNPAQRIMYVDRIRRELAEAKLQIAELSLEKERAETQGRILQKELEMFTSVMVPVGNKPRTNITRVTRIPLANMTENLNQSALASAKTIGHSYPSSPMDDLTVDELL